MTIDAVPDRTFKGRVTEIGNSPIQTHARRRTRDSDRRPPSRWSSRSTRTVPDVRPGFTCTAEITTAKRKNVVAVPIQALTVREMLYNDKGEMVRETPNRRRRGTNIETPVSSASNEPPPGHTRKETEGVFVVRDGQGVFTAGQGRHRRRAVLRGARRASRPAIRSSPGRSRRCASSPTDRRRQGAAEHAATNRQTTAK